LSIKRIDGEYERAVNEQKKVLRDFKKKLKAQEEQIQHPHPPNRDYKVRDRKGGP